MSTCIIPDDQRKDVLHLSVGESFYREIHVSIFGKHPKIRFCEENAEEQFSAKEFERARYFVFKRLSQRGYSSFELRNQLQERLVSEQGVEQVLAECFRLGYLDDEVWIEQFIREQKLRKTGPKMIAAKLYKKKVPRSFFEPFLENLLTLEEQKEAIDRLLATRFRLRNLDDFKEKNKIFAALQRKGFTVEAIKQSLGSC